MASLKVKVSFPAFMTESRGVGEAGGISGEDLDLSLWWINLAENSLFMEEWNW